MRCMLKLRLWYSSLQGTHAKGCNAVTDSACKIMCNDKVILVQVNIYTLRVDMILANVPKFRTGFTSFSNRSD